VSLVHGLFCVGSGLFRFVAFGFCGASFPMIGLSSAWIWGWFSSLGSSALVAWVFFLRPSFCNRFFSVGGPSLLEDVFVVSF
jgi:hypothetical protein